MEAIIQARKLKEQVGALQGILARKETIPVLSRIKIEAGMRGDLVMTATDLDISLIIEQEVDVLRSGSICLSGRKLGLLAGNLPAGEPVHLRLDERGKKVEFRAGRFVSRLSGTESEQFPEVPRVAGESVKLPASVFYEGLRRTGFALTEETGRFTLNAVLLVIESARLKMVSTDGHRLCFFRMATTAGSGQNFECLIPSKAARELKGLLADEIRANQNAEIRVKKGSQLEFEIGNKRMTARELTGTFPNWELVVPKNFESFAEINAKQFAEALTRVGVMADDTHRRVELVFHAGKVILKTESPETGSSVEEVACKFQKLGQPATIQADGEEDAWKIAFNTKYLMDFFSIHGAKRDEQRVIWKFAGQAQTEMVFEGEEKLFSYILVPLKA
jgi:DNA polymerase III subunit beta